MTLVAVAKSQPPAALAEAFEAGVRDFGESYVQEALAKIAALRGVDARWHFIGHVQANKARDIAGAFDWVHGVDRLKVAQALSKARPEARAPLEVCIQVNISGEATKGGVAPGEALGLAREVARMPGLRLRGLMGMASFTPDTALQRGQFHALAETRRAIVAAGIPMDTLSMGMSEDFEAALAEGATLVRIGRAIFGERGKRQAA